MHAEQGLDVVRLNPGFVYGPGALLRSAFVEQARKGRLRCIGNGPNRWSCVHVDDQGRAYAAPLTGAGPAPTTPSPTLVASTCVTSPTWSPTQ
jgi:nucleoside-diphosphate-sugar epimerase